MSATPPRKQNGNGRGPRKLNGAILDVRSAAEYFGGTEKWIRSQVSRQRLPFRRHGARIVFVKAELEKFVSGLPVGCSVAEALQHQQMNAEQKKRPELWEAGGVS